MSTIGLSGCPKSVLLSQNTWEERRGGGGVTKVIAPIVHSSQMSRVTNLTLNFSYESYVQKRQDYTDIE